MTRRSFGHIRKLPSKRFQASYVSSNGLRVNAPHTFLTKTDANAWLSSEETRLRRGETFEAPSAALAKISPIFEEFMRRHIDLQTTSNGSLLRKSTKDLYMRLLQVNLKHFWGMRLDQITVADVNEWWASAIADGKKTTASKAYKLLSAGLKRAVYEKQIEANPCQVKGAQGAITGKRVDAPSLEEVKQISKHINPRFSKMVILMAFSGLRFGEITELRRKDVVRGEIDGKLAFTLRVERAVTLVNGSSGKKIHYVDLPKSSAGIREVILPSSMSGIVEEILASAPGEKDALLFSSAGGKDKHIRHDVFMNSWRQAVRRAGISEGKYSPHGLRHFAGSHLHKAGATIAELKEWLGDSSTAAVMRYVHSTGRTASIVDSMISEDAFLDVG